MSLSLTIQGQCKFRCGEEYKTGRVWKVFEGSFAHYPRVLVKQLMIADKNRRDLAKNEICLMQKLSDSQHIAKMFHINVVMGKASLIVQRYEFNLSQYLNRLVKAGGLTTVYDEPTIFRQVFAGLSFMHEKMIAHRDVKLKNVYIHKASGKHRVFFAI